MKNIIKINSINSIQVARIQEITNFIWKDKNLKQTILNYDKENFMKVLKSNFEFGNLIENYIKDFGGRFADELKLETKDIF